MQQKSIDKITKKRYCNITKQQGGVYMLIPKTRTNREIDEGKRISALFSTLSEENKTMAIVYLSALRDKEIADGEIEKELQEV